MKTNIDVTTENLHKGITGPELTEKLHIKEKNSMNKYTQNPDMISSIDENMINENKNYKERQNVI